MNNLNWKALMVAAGVLGLGAGAQADVGSSAFQLNVNNGEGICNEGTWSAQKPPQLSGHVFTGTRIVKCSIRLGDRAGDMDKLAKTLMEDTVHKAVQIVKAPVAEHQNHFEAIRMTLKRIFGEPASRYQLNQIETIGVADDKKTLVYDSGSEPQSFARIKRAVINERNISISALKTENGVYSVELNASLKITKDTVFSDGLFFDAVKADVSKQVQEGAKEVINAALKWL